MANARERIVILESDAATRVALQATMQNAGYDVTTFDTASEGLDAIHASGADLLLLDSRLPDASAREALATIRGSATTEAVRVILLVGTGAEERAAAIDLGADDAISRPWEPVELLARIRSQFRVQRAENQMRDKMRLAEEGQQIAHTAFEALAVTEKMTSDAFTLDRRLKIGFGAVFVLAAIMAIIYFGFVRSASKATQRANATIAKLEGGLVHQQDLIAEARKLREQGGADSATVPVGKDELKRRADELKSKMAGATSTDMASLQQQLQETNDRLKRIEKEGSAAQNIIPMDVQSVCLLHVSVAFTQKESGRRLRYAGLNPQGEPLQDSGGNPVLTLEGRGPEVKLDIFGTGFVVGTGGRVLTNRHVAEPWWKNDELNELTSQGFQPEISLIRAYFPGDPRAFHAEIQEISKDTDLATVRVDVQDLKRAILSVDATKTAATSGEPIVLMGYA
ncbi:MAG: response regulator, partial [Candidatus Acidiferrales bacterium]